jgi:hypothetical protein
MREKKNTYYPSATDAIVFVIVGIFVLGLIVGIVYWWRSSPKLSRGRRVSVSSLYPEGAPPSLLSLRGDADYYPQDIL